MNQYSFFLCTGVRLDVLGTMSSRLSIRSVDGWGIMLQHIGMQAIGVLMAVCMLTTAFPEGLNAQTTSQVVSVRELEAARQKVKLVESEYIEAFYTIARIHARRGCREDSYLALDHALGAGFNDVGRL